MSDEDAISTCIAWGPLGERLKHLDCPTVLLSAEGAAVPVTVPLPAVCTCECMTCKRAWWAKGRPRIVDGEIIRRYG